MINGLKPYPAMKDSGVPWLGAVPEHWEVETIGRLGTLFKGNGGSKADEVSVGIPCVRYGDLYTRYEFFIPSSRSFVAEERSKAYTPISYGDVLFAASGETFEEIGRSAVNLMKGSVVCGGDVIVLRPKREVVPRFLGYATNSFSAAWQKTRFGKGFTIVHLYGSDLKRLSLALPPLAEQRAIVRLLDHADRLIRRYIGAKQKLIRLLKEQKQAIIHRAVTRGLDPNVRLKPSGVEWLGDVPAHWEVIPIKRAFHLMDYGISESASDEGHIRFLTMANIKSGTVTIPESGGVSDVDPALLLAEHDLLFNRTNSAELVGKVGLFRGCPYPVTFASYLVRMRPQPNHSSEYLNLLLNDRSVLSVARREAIPSLHQSNLNPTRYGRLKIALPSLSEQQAIIDHIRLATADLDRTVANSEQELSLVREYRARLIADVVTGKLDVREAAARLPEETEEAEPLDEIEPSAGGDDEGEPVDLDDNAEEAAA